MEIASLRNRLLVGAFATVMIVGSGAAAALVTSSDTPKVGEAVDTTATTGDTVGTTTPSTPGSTIGTTPGDSDDAKADDGDADDTTEVARYWDPAECGGDEAMNHGQYVSSQPKGGESRSTAAHSDCGKPLASIGDDGDDGDESEDTPDADAPEAGGTPSPSASPGKSGSAPGHNK